jgi:hypothetical protein
MVLGGGISAAEDCLVSGASSGTLGGGTVGASLFGSGVCDLEAVSIFNAFAF